MVGSRLDPPDQLYRLRKSHPALRNRWKVTSRFTIEGVAGSTVRCVRLRHGSQGPVKHYTEAALASMFIRLTEDEVKAMRTGT
ncbi:MAG: hypothetical protein KAJ19_18140 [Gammaproteobacteria bacterium]|nr:hypothetical protein [Gammaproteobacteria bacterium]